MTEVGSRFVAKALALYKDETGTTSVEYVLILALVVVTSLLVIANLQQSISSSFNQHKQYYEGGR